MNVKTQESRYTVISADTHAGAPILGYKEYLPRELQAEFDTWAANFSDGWGQFDDGEDEGEVEQRDVNIRKGVASFMSPYNWDSPQRMTHLEQDGVAAEVIFPNTVPPFYPSGAITAPPPSTREDYRRRWAGVQAHNRWLAEFCNDVPGRRKGIAQILFNDVDDAVAEVKKAKEMGLGGVIIPGDHHLQLIQLYAPRLDPFWTVCAELNMPVHRHSAAVAEAETAETGPASPLIGVYENFYFSFLRAVPHLTLGGVLHRHPNLKFVFVEGRAAWALKLLSNLDLWFEEAKRKGSRPYTFGHRALLDQELSPSQYFHRNCYFASFFTEIDIAFRAELGVDRMMWGQDYPHHEATWPYSTIALRMNFSEVPEREVRMITSETAAGLYGFDLDFLHPVAARIGPTVAEIATPVRPDEIPNVEMCPTFKLRPGDPDFEMKKEMEKAGSGAI
jgi:predicted TIM-barrel fold metal-dependent hydrolase